jgi:hypothetical protein
MISGYMTELISERVRRHGINQLLCKPFSFAELKQAIALATEQSATDSPVANRRLKERRTKKIGTCTANRRAQPSRRSTARAL